MMSTDSSLVTYLKEQLKIAEKKADDRLRESTAKSVEIESLKNKLFREKTKFHTLKDQYESLVDELNELNELSELNDNTDDDTDDDDTDDDDTIHFCKCASKTNKIHAKECKCQYICESGAGSRLKSDLIDIFDHQVKKYDICSACRKNPTALRAYDRLTKSPC